MEDLSTGDFNPRQLPTFPHFEEASQMPIPPTKGMERGKCPKIAAGNYSFEAKEPENYSAEMVEIRHWGRDSELI